MALQKLGKYEILSEIGRGAMGLVYKAHDPILERQVAVKTMMASAAGLDSESKARFYREARSAAKITHRNIVTIYDMGEEQGIPYIAMEYLDGIDLHRKMKREGVLPIREGLDIISQVLRGLDYAHQFQIVHRDIKPANVFILRNGTAKILDFGIAKLAASEMTRTGMVLGTVDYMSPEQIRAEKSVDGRSDIFSAGVILYEVISGSKPFPGDAITQIMYRIVHEPPVEIPPERELPGNLREICHRALEKSPGDRYQTAEEFAQAIESIMLQMDAELTTIRLESPEFDAASRLATARRLFESGSFDQASALLKKILEEDPGSEQAAALMTRIEKRRASDSTLVLEPEGKEHPSAGRSSIEEILEEIEEERRTSPPVPGRSEVGAPDLTVRLEDSGLDAGAGPVAAPPPEPPAAGLPSTGAAASPPPFKQTEVLSAEEIASVSMQRPAPEPSSPPVPGPPPAPAPEPAEEAAPPAPVPRPAPEPEPVPPAIPAPAPRPAPPRRPAAAPRPSPPAKRLSPVLLAAGAVVLVAAGVLGYIFLWPGQTETGGAAGPSVADAEAVPGAPAAGAAAGGWLAIDAHPWAAVVSVRETGSGRDVSLPTEAGSEAGPTTPLVLDLPEGTYEITLRHPELGEVTVADLVVTEGQETQVNRTMPGYSFIGKLPRTPP